MDFSSPSDRSKGIRELLRGRDIVTRLKTTFTTHTHATDDQSAMFDQLLSCFSNSISFFSRDSHDPDELSQFPGSTHVGSPDSGESSKSSGTLKGRRGCYKRRKTVHSWSRDSADLVDDGHQWRKYGQKNILKASFPRNYFRCTHKFDQQCPATKQVQRISEDPPVYRTTYYAHHTCNNFLQPSQLVIDTTDPSDSSKLINFTAATNNSPCKKVADPFLQPYFQPSTTVKKEYCGRKNDRDYHGDLSSHNNSLSSDYPFPNELLAHAFDQGDAISSCTTSSSTHNNVFDDIIILGCGDFEDDVSQYDFP